MFELSQSMDLSTDTGILYGSLGLVIFNSLFVLIVKQIS